MWLMKRTTVDGWDTDKALQEATDARANAEQAKNAAVKGLQDANTKFSEAQTTLNEVYAVGRYGLTPEWGDGHDTGIYTFKMLRRAAGLD